MVAHWILGSYWAGLGPNFYQFLVARDYHGCLHVALCQASDSGSAVTQDNHILRSIPWLCPQRLPP